MPIILQKKGAQHHIQLQKDDLHGAIVIQLQWSNGAPVDLDLGCYYELRDGKRCLIDALQFMNGNGGPADKSTKQGCYINPPYIWHTGDDRGDNDSSKETIIVNAKGLADIKRIIVYAYIYEGAAKWSLTDAVVKVTVPHQQPVNVQMGEVNDKRRFCAIAQIDFDNDNSITVKRLVSFHNSHSDCDIQYGWGFTYAQHAKS